MDIEIEDRNGDVESRLHRLCRELLSNPVIEDYELQKEPSAKQERKKSATGETAK